MSQLQIRLFGGFQAHLDEQPIRFPTQKVRALFAYLSVEAKSAHPREKLMTLFWPEQSQNSASNNLRQTLSRLRSVLPADTLLIRDNEIQFNLKSSHRVDVTAFVQAFSAKALDDMASASELYQGDFLAHFSLLDSPIFEEWALLKREWLRSEALKMLHHLTLAYEQAERHEDAIHAARRQVEIDSLHEVAWQQLMRNLALAGRRSEALDQFELCRQILEKELEVEPAQETTQLAQQIRAGKFATKSIGQPSQLASLNETIVPTRLFNIPTPLTPLVGREVELARLAELLAEPSIRLLTILGPGGMGKTHLALAAVAAEKEHFANGVAFVSLAPLQSSEAVISAIAASLRFSFHNNGDPLSQLRDYLREKEFLLLLDNFEHLLSATAILIDLLEHAPQLKCLATSRVALGTIGEQLFMLDGVTVPPSDPKTLAEVDHYGAVRLFVQSAKRLNPAFRLDTQVQPAVIAICRHVQGMPLGILLATAWLQTLSLDEIVAQLNSERRDSASERLDFWEADQPAITSQQRSLRTVFERSWRLLGEREQRAFQRLSIFRGGFTAHAAKAIGDVTLHDLRALVNHSLVRRAEDGRYDMHELVRQYAAERFEIVGQGDATLNRHAEYFADLLARHSQYFRRDGELQALDTLKPDTENVHVAWRWALDHNQWELLECMITPLGLFYDLSGRRQEGEAVFTQAADHFAQQPISLSFTPSARCHWAHCLAWQSDYCSASAKAEVIDQLLQQAQELLDQAPVITGSYAQCTQAFLWLLRAYRTRNIDLTLAEALGRQSLILYRQLNDLPRTADALLFLTAIAYALHGAAADRTYLSEALQIRRKLDDKRGIVGGLNMLRTFAQDESRFDEAEAIVSEGLQILETVGAPSELANNLWLLGQTQVLNGKFTQAKQALGQSVRIWQELGVRALYAATLDEYCHARLHLGEYEGTMQDLWLAAAIKSEVDIKQELGLVYSDIGMLQLAQHQLLDSKQSYQKGCEYVKGFDINAYVYNLALLVYTECALGDYVAAYKTFTEAMLLVQQVNYHFTGKIAIGGYALLLAETGHVEEAIVMYSLACQFVMIRQSRWFADIAGRYIAERAASLPNFVIESAQKRGQALDYKETVDRLIEELQQITQLNQADEGSPETGQKY